MIKYKLLSEVADVIDSLHQTPNYSKQGLPFLRCKDIKSEDIDISECKLVDDDTFKKFSKNYLPKNGDLVISRVGSYGNISRVNDVNFCLGQNISAIVPKKINSSYLYFILNTQSIKNQIETMIVGSTQKTLSLKAIKSLKIPILNENDEKETSEIIQIFEKKIRNIKQMNKLLEQIIHTIYNLWFKSFVFLKDKKKSKFFKSFPKELIDSKKGNIPKGWSIVPISQITEKTNEKIKNKKDWSNKKLIDLSRMPKKSISLFEYGKGIELSTSVISFKKFDFLFGSIRPYFFKAGLCPFDGVTNTSVFVLKPKKEIYREFLYSVICSKNTFEESIQFSKGTKMPIISWKDFSSFEIILPDEKILDLYSKITKPLFQKIISNIEEYNTVNNLRIAVLNKKFFQKFDLN